MPDDRLGDEYPCDRCETEVHQDDMYQYGPEQMCQDCWDDMHVECAWCGTLEPEDDMNSVGWQGTLLCYGCFDHCITCEGCESPLHMDDSYYSERHDRSYCEECYYEQSPDFIRAWGDRPDLVFHGDMGYRTYSPERNTTYFGIEIEVAHILDEDVEAYASTVEDYENKMWITTDSSVDDGYEFVTMPATLAAIQDGAVIDWDAWSQAIHSRVPDQSRELSNGIHVHINREAFSTRVTKYDRHLFYGGEPAPSSAHLYRFIHFIQSHEHAVQAIAGREYSDYCQWDYTKEVHIRKKDAQGSTNNSQRYRPINTQNHATIEVRIFDGRTDRTFILRAVEFLHSVLEYTRSIKGFGRWHDYADWLKLNRTQYMSDLYLVVSDYSMIDRANASYHQNKRIAREAMKRRREMEAMAVGTLTQVLRHIENLSALYDEVTGN